MYRPEIDGLRAVAVLAIFAYHAGFSVVSGGYVGVDIFFVISGFLITSIILKDLSTGTFSFATFYERRCRRILPPVFLMAVVISAVSIFTMLLNFDLFTRSLGAMALFVSNIWHSRQTGYFDTNAEYMPFLHTWSLAVEEQFYLFFPVLLILLHKIIAKKMRQVLIIIAFVSFASSTYFIIHSPKAVFFLTHFRAWELLLGAIAAMMPIRQLSRSALLGFSILASCLIIVPIFTFTSSMRFPGISALPPCLGTAILIYVHKQGIADSLIGRFLAKPAMVGIGKISYSLYLWHWPVFIIHKVCTGGYVASHKARANYSCICAFDIINKIYRSANTG
ncbi:MAG: acyltransferase [Deferribacteraceae bacterium]|nr:acyltransferase [Deferribacteraceae bacterium]